MPGSATTKASAKKGRWDAPFDQAPEGAIREEIFSAERLESHSQKLAFEHLHATGIRRGRSLSGRVRENGLVLDECYRELALAVSMGKPVPPSAKWLLDNFHLVSGQWEAIREDLPSSYYRELPKLGQGELKGYPRIYSLAWKWVAHCDSHFDSETLRRYISAYQRTQPLTIGELWALPITLRIVLLENLRRQAEWVVASLRDRERADDLADRLLGLGPGPALDGAKVPKRFAGKKLPLAFGVRLYKRLSDQDAPIQAVLEWLDARLSQMKTTAEAVARQEHQEGLAKNATVKNAITSLRDISLFDWPGLVEELSLVDQVFRSAFDFQGLNFATRDRYRHAVESLGRGSQYSQIEIAQFAAKKVMSAKATGPSDAAQRDVGYYLIGPGSLDFESQIKYQPPLSRQLLRALKAFAAPLYLGALFFLCLWALSLPLEYSWFLGLGSFQTLLMACLAVIPASEIAVTLLNHAVMKLWPPRSLPKLALKGGIPAQFRSMVVMPVMLEDEKSLAELIETLEIHYLANSDGEIFFGLLTDWPDAPVAEKAGEAALLQKAHLAMAELNRKHSRQGQPRFGLYHRRRLYNASEGSWMGWERKRGKLTEFNRLLRGATDSSYMAAPSAVPAGVRFVITLDQDTRLPLGAAIKLVGAMAHPLNQPRLNDAKDRVVRGYGILQPRISPTLLSQQEATLFNRLSSGRAGADPYAFAVSDVYQDLFGEGSYTGKGIYDVDAFEASLAGRVPENSLLSHDLFEGGFARAGLVSDVEFFEEFPGHYQAAAACKERWTRGDWQLLPWILNVGRGRGAKLVLIQRWKMLDNLRRSLLAPMSLATLGAALFLPVPAALAWGFLALLGLSLPPLLSVLVTDLVPRRRDFSLRKHWRTLRQDLRSGLLQFAFSAAMLPAQAWLMLCAISISLAHLSFRKKHLLQWVRSRLSRRNQARSTMDFFRLLKAGPIAAVALGLAAYGLRPEAWWMALPCGLFWLASPLLCRRFSLPLPLPELARLKPQEAEALLLSARRTWHYFETFVDASVHYLPPDNYQEEPAGVLADRSSPTNLGLYLLACVSAHDFGWLASASMLDRVEKALQSMEAMEKHQGHFFNWYQLSTLKPLEPRFVSTVDSGNLAGHLLVAREALLELARAPAAPQAPFAGMKGSLALARLASEGGEFRLLLGIHHIELRRVLALLATAVAEAPLGAAAYESLAARVKGLTGTLLDIATSLSEAGESRSHPLAGELLRWSTALNGELNGHLAPRHPGLEARAAAAAARMQALFDAMHFKFLYDASKKLFSIGYRPSDGGLDSGSYDLLASEARLSSFLAVARGEVDTEHWFRLGRPLTPLGSGAALLSWSGSMFEYLMPLLVMPSPPGSLLSETYAAVVKRQIEYGRERRLPWGVSESACNIRDKDMTYQYADFGVEGLGIKRGIGRQRVVAPYATALALMVDPAAAASNLAALSAMGAEGVYGYYDAIDFGSGLFPEGRPWAVVKAWMAHHQGMSLVAILHVLKDGAMQRRFQAVPIFKAASLLLQERSSGNLALSRPASSEEEAVPSAESEPPELQRVFNSPHLSLPQTQLLGNENYSVMLTDSGGGYSAWKGADITRFRRDPSRDPWGSFIFIRDLKGGEPWSATYLPSRKEPDSYHVLFREDKAEYSRKDGHLESRLEVAVSPEDDVELRRLTLKNNGSSSMELELTSYAELAMADEAADMAHPAFAKLFVQTEYVAELGALLAHRRPRDSKQEPLWAAHLSFSESDLDGVHFETDRMLFLGRGNDISDPAMMREGRLLSNTVGAVLDPVFSLRRRLRLGPGENAQVCFATMAAFSREKVLALASKIRNRASVDRLFGQAWIHAQVQMRHRGIQPEESRLFQTLAGQLMYPDRRLRAPAEIVVKNRLGARALWGHGISGDLPVLLLRIDESSDRELLRQTMLAWDYWRLKNLAVDLVILNEEPASYADSFQKELEDLARRHMEAALRPLPGGIVVVKACGLHEAERDLLLCSARAILRAGQGGLAEQLARIQAGRSLPPGPDEPREADSPPLHAKELEFSNGLGGFDEHGREYRIVLEDGQATPAPWVNVIANEDFGFLASESGSGYTWSNNARENKLSPWSNDPVSDPAGEAFYVRDEESGDLFCPTALPIRLRGGRYVARHGQGYSRFESTAFGIEMALTQFVALKDPVKVSLLRIKNVSGRARKLSLTAYVQWVLGSSAQSSARWVKSAFVPELGLLTAENPSKAAFPEALAFLDLGGNHRSFTLDRRDFLGRHGSMKSPQALGPGMRLSGRAGEGLDPCAALQSYIELKAGETHEFRVLLGEVPRPDELENLVKRFRSADSTALLDEVKAFWDASLGALQVKTPDRAMDIMLNRWLPYQTLSCRIWARTAFYQCGGAWGFRDQLQDVLALTQSQPEIVRRHLVRAAEKQFAEGDVLHWWHPPTGAGVRTRITDDRLWLPYAVSRYAEASGDKAVFDQMVSFIDGPALAPGAEDLYFLPTLSPLKATLYEHCARALEVSLTCGAHGLPLMGGGDWNDGMNRVGAEGRGESVWLAWFLIENLRRFAPIASSRGEAERAEQWLKKAHDIAGAVEKHGWDGDWYRRAFFDDGSPLGSAGLAECRIDAIAQSWAVLSRAAEPARAARAMGALEEFLWKKNDRLQLLLSPPFSKNNPDPGYIMGYLPGIRENGGQYNHAATWSVAAFAALGEGAKAHELFATLNPVVSAGTRAGMQRFKVEPYVMAGDVYSQAPHVGRGGWSWYSGSAAWMQRVGVESILGLTLHGDSICIDPCVPPSWPGFEMRLKWRNTAMDIEVLNPDAVSRGVKAIELDGRILTLKGGDKLPYPGDGSQHRLKVTLGAE